jgi:hypothetical protein
MFAFCKSSGNPVFGRVSFDCVTIVRCPSLSNNSYISWPPMPPPPPQPPPAEQSKASSTDKTAWNSIWYSAAVCRIYLQIFTTIKIKCGEVILRPPVEGNDRTWYFLFARSAQDTHSGFLILNFKFQHSSKQNHPANMNSICAEKSSVKSLFDTKLATLCTHLYGGGLGA